MNEYISTPFDDLIWSCLQSELGNPVYPENNDTRVFLRHHLKILRRCYLNLLLARIEPFNKKALRPKERINGSRPATREEMISTSDITLGFTLAYFDYLNAINQFGRAFTEKCQDRRMPPLYQRIKFFRNKVSEHWEEYAIDYAKGAGLTQSGGDIPQMIPITRDYAFTATEIARKFFEQEIQKQIPSFKLPTTYDHELNCEAIYGALETAYPSYIGIPNKIVNQLFGVGFPLPFYRTETYTACFIDYFKSLIEFTPKSA